MKNKNLKFHETTVLLLIFLPLVIDLHHLFNHIHLDLNEMQKNTIFLHQSMCRFFFLNSTVHKTTPKNIKSQWWFQWELSEVWLIAWCNMQSQCPFEELHFENKWGVEFKRSELTRSLQPTNHLCLKLAAGSYISCYKLLYSYWLFHF